MATERLGYLPLTRCGAFAHACRNIAIHTMKRLRARKGSNDFGFFGTFFRGAEPPQKSGHIFSAVTFLVTERYEELACARTLGGRTRVQLVFETRLAQLFSTAWQPRTG